MSKILITGASRGLGQVCCEAFSKDGWEVIPFTRKELDFTLINPAWMANVPEVDAILHCAGGGLGYRGPYLTPGQLYELFMVNVGGAVEINRRFAPVMQTEGKGNIIHIGSIASGQAVGSLGYNVMKSALSAYVRSLGRELAPYGVTVCGLAPGGFTAPDNAMERLRDREPEVYAHFIKSRLPRGKMGQAQDLIPLIKLLATDQSGMFCGSMIPVDWAEGTYYAVL